MVSSVRIQTVNTKTNYSSKTASDTNSNFNEYISSVKKQNVQKEEPKADTYDTHQEKINKLKDAIDDYSNDSADSKEKLKDALNDVAKMMKDDKTMTQDEIAQVKKLLSDIPNDIKEDSSIKSIVLKIIQSIDKFSSLTQSINNDNQVTEAAQDTDKDTAKTNTDKTKDTKESDEAKVNKDDDSDTSIEALLQAVQSLLAKLQDLNSRQDSNGANVKETLVNQLKTLLDSVQKNPQDAGKMIKEFLSQNSDQITKLLQTSGLDNKEITHIIDKLKDFTEIKTEVETGVGNSEMKIEQTPKAEINNSSSTEDKEGDSSDTPDNSSLKEEKILKSIIKGTDNNVVNRFTLVNSGTQINTNSVTVNQPVINQSTMAQDVIQTIKYMSTQGVDELLVKVNPRELGELVINIVKDGDMMKAQIKASSKETYALLMQNSDDLKKYLGEQNIKISHVDISLAQDTTQNRQGSFFGESGRQQSNSSSYGKDNDNSQYEEVDDVEEEDLLANINMLV